MPVEGGMIDNVSKNVVVLVHKHREGGATTHNTASRLQKESRGVLGR